MKVLIVGNGGREHALAWILSRTADVISTPTNPGIAGLGRCFDVAVDDLDGIAKLVKEQEVDLVVVGPELPLTLGIVDRLAQDGIKVFGPNRSAARIEGSKVFAKNLMRKYQIPTAPYEVFLELDAALAYVEKKGAPVVIKANGLAAGKGAIVCQTLDEARAAVRSMLADRKFGDAGNEVVIEECMVGEEASILALTDGQSILVLPSSQDHKRAFDNDQGPNTGGMGAYSPAPCVSPEIMGQIRETILTPTIEAMAREGAPYSGVLYAGLMLTQQGPKVVEFNCRFGDPEAQAVLPLLQGDFAQVLYDCACGKLNKHKVQIQEGAAACVVLASQGYPGSYPKDKIIQGLHKVSDNVVVFHAGTRQSNGRVVTSGGRVLGVTGIGNDLESAVKTAYAAVEKIHFEGAQYRKDIGAKGLTHLVKG